MGGGLQRCVQNINFWYMYYNSVYVPRLFPYKYIFGHLELALVCAIFVSQEITIDYYYL